MSHLQRLGRMPLFRISGGGEGSWGNRDNHVRALDRLANCFMDVERYIRAILDEISSAD